jgi:hypothetical protein
MRDASKQSKDKTKAMKQRRGAAQNILLGQSHAIPYGLSIVYDVVMCEHGSFGSARCPARKLYIENIVTAHCCFYG